jgi:type II restriction enzyme|tara:strand:+ start:894 stop:1037 length:144 start_codon:yes stop_codon:yes gene_type:complete
MAKKNQSKRLTTQHKKSQGVVGIFGDGARSHDTIQKIITLFVRSLEL